MFIQLKPNSNKNRELIRLHGEIWIALEAPSHKSCFQGQLGVLVQSLKDDHIRNFRMSDVLKR